MNFTIKKVVIICIYFCSLFAIQGKQLTYPYGEFSSNYWQFWFLYEREYRPGQKEVIFRPFYSSYYDKVNRHQYDTSFYPFYYKESTYHWKKWSFLFLFNGDSVVHPDTGQDEDVSIPFFQWGKGDTERERYRSYFPLFGTVKSKLGYNEISFVLFPLYANWRYKDFQAYSILWPLTLYGSSKVRKEYRFLPFFSHKSHIGKYSHNSILWPFIQWGVDNLDKKEPTSYTFFFLLYAYKKSAFGNMKSFSLTYPLTLFSYGYDRRTSEYTMNALFYLIQFGYSNDKDYRRLMFIPFYGYSRYASKEFRLITPLYIHLKSDTYLVKSNFHMFFPFYFYTNEYYVKEKRRSVYHKFWPFFRWYKDYEGNLSWNALSLFPVKSISFERIWDPIWSIVEYQKMINGEKRLSFLMRLYTQRWNKNDFHIYIPLLLDLSLEKRKTDIKFLYGLFGYEKKKGKRNYQLFWFINI